MWKVQKWHASQRSPSCRYLYTDSKPFVAIVTTLHWVHLRRQLSAWPWTYTCHEALIYSPRVIWMTPDGSWVPETPSPTKDTWPSIKPPPWLGITLPTAIYLVKYPWRLTTSIGVPIAIWGPNAWRCTVIFYRCLFSIIHLPTWIWWTLEFKLREVVGGLWRSQVYVQSISHHSRFRVEFTSLSVLFTSPDLHNPRVPLLHPYRKWSRSYCAKEDRTFPSRLVSRKLPRICVDLECWKAW